MDRTTSDWGKRLNSSEMLVEIDGGSNWFRNVMETVTKEIKVLVVTSPAIHMETNRSDFQYTSCVDNLRWATRAFDSYALYHDQADKKTGFLHRRYHLICVSTGIQCYGHVTGT